MLLSPAVTTTLFTKQLALLMPETYDKDQAKFQTLKILEDKNPPTLGKIEIVNYLFLSSHFIPPLVTLHTLLGQNALDKVMLYQATDDFIAFRMTSASN